MTTAALRTSRVRIRSSIAAYGDGNVYSWPRSLHFTETNYTRVAFAGDLVFKMPTKLAISEYKRFVVREEQDTDAIRPNEPVEKPCNFCELVERYPTFKNCSRKFGSSATHWLLLHRMQYDRLHQLPDGTFRIPEARFVFLRRRNAIGRMTTRPCLVQERVQGIDLTDMLATANDEYGNETVSYIQDEYERFLPAIGKSIRRVAESEWSDHINWYVRNFFFTPATGTVDYVDLKPSTIFGRHRNDLNLNALMRDFAQDPAYCQ